MVSKLLAAGTVAIMLTTACTTVAARPQSTHAGRAAIIPALADNTCTAPGYPALAAKITSDIAAAVHGRQTISGIRVEDRVTGLECRYSEGRRFDSASVVKASILAAVLLWKQEAHTSLTSTERTEATLMITQSDNNAASFFWGELGARFQHYLTLATMTETVPSPGGTWGLTQVTARDELQQLRLLTTHNPVLTDASRAYELNLMAHVISSERWGTPSGAPAGLNVYVKNGWLPRATLGWRINSIGAFTGNGRNYMIAMVTDNNPTMSYGVTTIERVAQAVHRDLPAPKSNLVITPCGTR